MYVFQEWGKVHVPQEGREKKNESEETNVEADKKEKDTEGALMVEDKVKDGDMGEEHKNGESLGAPTLYDLANDATAFYENIVTKELKYTQVHEELEAQKRAYLFVLLHYDSVIIYWHYDCVIIYWHCNTPFTPSDAKPVNEMLCLL